MKKLTLFLLLHSAALTLFAQKEHPQLHPGNLVNPQTDKRGVAGLTVLLQPAPRNTFLFAVYEKGRQLYSVRNHPVLHTPDGFATREAAFRAAEFFIASYRQSKTFPTQINPADARRLGLTQLQPQ